MEHKELWFLHFLFTEVARLKEVLSRALFPRSRQTVQTPGFFGLRLSGEDFTPCL